jgi:hypothetical protein
MKAKLILIVLVLFIMAVLNNNLRAQEYKKNVLTLSLTNLCILTPTLYYERVIGEKISLQLGAFYTGIKTSGVKFDGLGIIPEFRFYPGSYGAPRGFYCALFAKYQSFGLNTTVDMTGIPSYDAEATSSRIVGGLIMGGQIYAADVVVLDVFIGPSVVSANTKYKGTATEADFEDIPFINLDGTRVGIRFGISLGFGF